MSHKHLHSIHVSHYKHTAGCATEVMPIPDVVKISMSQHIGAPCKPLVQKGDYVKVGQLIGDTDAFVSAPIHSTYTQLIHIQSPISISTVPTTVHKLRNRNGSNRSQGSGQESATPPGGCLVFAGFRCEVPLPSPQAVRR